MLIKNTYIEKFLDMCYYNNRIGDYSEKKNKIFY